MFSPMAGRWPKARRPRSARIPRSSRHISARMDCKRPPVLSVDDLRSGYGRIEALHGVSLEVRSGEIVSLIGANGAGKTTLLCAVSGLHPSTGGSVRLQGKSIDRMPSHQRVAAGIT